MLDSWGRQHRGGIALALFCLLALIPVTSASAQDLPASIAASEARVQVDAGEVGELKDALAPVTSHLEQTSRRAAPIRTEVRRAKRQVATLERRAHTRQATAAARAARIEESNRKSSEKHEEKVTSGVGLGLALLAIAAIVTGWGWFRASAAVAALTRLTLGRAVGLCVGSGLLAVIVGAVLRGSQGATAALAMALLVLGLILPVAFLLARHSAEIQRGRSRPLLRRERFPVRLTQGFAAVLALFSLIAFSSALLAPTAESNDVPAAVRSEADSGIHDYRPLAAAEKRVKRLEEKAAPLFAGLRQAKQAARRVKGGLAHAEARMTAAEGKAEAFSRRLVALEGREEREREAAERREEKERAAEERAFARAAEREAEEFEEAGACDPNYVGECLHDGIGDYDCAEGSGDGPNYVYSPVEVVGADPFGLDEDGNGIGCQDE